MTSSSHVWFPDRGFCECLVRLALSRGARRMSPNATVHDAPNLTLSGTPKQQTVAIACL